MKKVIVQSGACGYLVIIKAVKGEDQKVRIALETDCEMVRKMQQDTSELERMDAFKGFLDNPVYRSAAKHLKHVACPVPAGILKALEVETGLNIAKDATIVFPPDEAA